MASSPISKQNANGRVRKVQHPTQGVRYQDRVTGKFLPNPRERIPNEPTKRNIVEEVIFRSQQHGWEGALTQGHVPGDNAPANIQASVNAIHNRAEIPRSEAAERLGEFFKALREGQQIDEARREHIRT